MSNWSDWFQTCFTGKINQYKPVVLSSKAIHFGPRSNFPVGFQLGFLVMNLSVSSASAANIRKGHPGGVDLQGRIEIKICVRTNIDDV